MNEREKEDQEQLEYLREWKKKTLRKSKRRKRDQENLQER